MPATKTHWWSQAPFLRLANSLIVGIIVQWYIQATLAVLSYIGLFFSALVVSYSFLPLSQKFRFAALNGVCIGLLVATLGGFLTWHKDIRNHQTWFGHQLRKNRVVVATLHGPLVEKPNSYKATAVVRFVADGDPVIGSEGKVLLYFEKEAARKLTYGSRIVIDKPLQEVRNSGNPGGFDYRRYCLFQGITHQVYLTEQDFTVLEGREQDALQAFLIQNRLFLIDTLKQYINGEKEAGLAEALLIGYKDDLDKSLVQAYSNTGVVHVIAISGLHLGLIYWLVLLLTKPIKRFKGLTWLRFVLIISILWLFTLLAGAQPSVLRSAVMFSCIALGEVIGRRVSVYNTLAMSAFLLLCINPFWLWDVGFQLSYAAVLSIIIFYRPIYNWFYFPNKSLSWLWKMIAVTLSAQILTLPISVHHFHQFPVLFILTNLVAVPLSSIILIGEILLCALAFMPMVASVIGTAITYCIRFMNFYIERYDAVSFTAWNGLSISMMQTLLLFLVIACIAYWLMEERKGALLAGLAFLAAFLLLRTISFIDASKQRKLIVYNTPKYQAIDLIEGRQIRFAGDASLLQDDYLYNFHLKPSRVLHRAKAVTLMPDSLKSFDLCTKKAGIIDRNISFQSAGQKQKMDVLILSKNPRLYISDIHKAFHIEQIVIDGSVPTWKARLWKKGCDSLRLPYHDVAEKGAFVMNLR